MVLTVAFFNASTCTVNEAISFFYYFETQTAELLYSQVSNTLMNTKIVLVTGANRGIGYEIAKLYHSNGWSVIGTARSPASATQLASFAKHVLELDTGNPSSIQSFAAQLAKHTDHIDLLINNAGVLHRDTVDDFSVEEIMEQIKVNALGPLLVSRSLLPLLRKSPSPRIINITSRMGSIADNTSGGYYGYRASKACLNCFSKSWSLDVKDVPVIEVHPGYIQTGMTSNKGDMGPEECAKKLKSGIFDEFMKGQGESKYKSGDFIHRDGQILPW